MTPFLRNQWYTAATSTELGAKPLARTICNEPLVIFRGEDGTAAVLTDRCPHRKAPLSSGEVIGSDIQCGYHGIRFAASGACTHVPGNVPVGRDFRARCFPAREVHGLIFVWLGEASLADPALIPDFGENVKPGWTGVYGMLYVKANYQLLIDNILDLTHVVFVHKTTLAGSGVAETPLHVVLNSFTPETERTTHYFWSTVRSWGLDDANVSKTYKDMTDLAFAEDARIVEGQQRLIDSDPSGTPLVSLAFDRAALAARRIIKRKLEEEAQATAPAVKASAQRAPVRGADVTA